MAPPANLEQLLATRTFPGMTAAESRLIRAYLAKHGAAWDTASVIEKIGQGVILPPHITDAKARADWEKRTRMRPDLVLTRPRQAAVVEAKEYATNEGVWQVLGYRDVFAAEHPGVAVIPVMVCEAFAPTAKQLAETQRVEMWLYNFDEPATPPPDATEAPA